MQHVLSRFIVYGVTVRGSLLDRVLPLGESLPKGAFCNCIITKTAPNNYHNFDSIRHLLRNDNFTKPYSHDYVLVNLNIFSPSLRVIMCLDNLYLVYILYHVIVFIVVIHCTGHFTILSCVFICEHIFECFFSGNEGGIK